MWFFLLACASATKAPTLPTAPRSPTADARVELLADGPIAQRLSPPDDAGLVVFYSGEQQGSLDPCGCATRPRGGLPRMASYTGASGTAQPAVPTIQVNGGYWLEDAVGLDGNPRADAPLLNQWMVTGLQQLGLDALNVGYNDLAGLRSLGEQAANTGLPLVSANVSGAGIVPYRIVQRGEMTIGITGITTPGSRAIPTPGFSTSEPFAAARDIVEQLAEETDIVVLLAFQASEAAKRLAQKGNIDVVIDTNQHRTLDAPFRVGQAIWVRSHFQTMRLGELRLGLNQGEINWAVDRKIDLDDQLPDDPNQATLSRMARKELRVIERELYGRPRR